MLLVLDNLEQVIDAAEDIAALVSRCPALQVIATSRAPLKIGAETEFSLPPLALPAPDMTSLDALRNCPSVALFLQRGAKVKQDFALTEANAPAIAAICRRLDGLPLALELAAARVRVLEPAALLQRLDHALDLLTSGDRDLPLRQRTLRAAISWSYSLLDAAEQRLLRRLSSFHEGWTFEAMEHVCYGDDERYRALDELDSLVEKGLVRVVGSGERYALLETIRAFAAEQLHAGGEVDATRHAHADYYLPVRGGRGCRHPQHRAARGRAACPHREREHASRHPVAHRLRTRRGQGRAREGTAPLRPLELVLAHRRAAFHRARASGRAARARGGCVRRAVAARSRAWPPAWSPRRPANGSARWASGRAGTKTARPSATRSGSRGHDGCRLLLPEPRPDGGLRCRRSMKRSRGVPVASPTSCTRLH